MVQGKRDRGLEGLQFYTGKLGTLEPTRGCTVWAHGSPAEALELLGIRRTRMTSSHVKMQIPSTTLRF